MDNTTVVYAWEKKYNKRDTELSILIRCLHVIEAFLGCKIYVKHTKRMSNAMAKMADKLSRSKTTDEETLTKIAHITVQCTLTYRGPNRLDKHPWHKLEPTFVTDWRY